MKVKLLFMVLILILSFATVQAQITREPLIANTFFFNESTTSSTTFVTVGENLFDVTRPTPISFVRSSFQGTKVTGSDALDEFFWRILLDGIEIVNATQSLEFQETSAIELQAGVGDLSIGTHNITFQHRISTETLRTSDISFSLITDQFLNSSRIPLQNQTVNFTVDDIEIFTLLSEVNFTKLSDDSNIFLSIFGQVVSEDPNVDVEIKLRINGEESGVLSTGIQDTSEIKFVTYSWFFDTVPLGTNTIEVLARNLQNTKVTSFDGTISIAETIGDGIEINFNDTQLGTFSTSSTTPVLVDSFMIDIANGSTLVIISETTVTKSTSGKDNITMFIDIVGFGASFNHTVQLEASSDIANFPFIAVPPALPSLAGLKNISLFVFVESTTVTLTNTSFFAIEILPIEVLVVVDNPPEVTLINPTDNTITNETFITFEANLKDDNFIFNASLFHNASGLFQLNSTQLVNSINTTVFFNITFPKNVTMVWNILTFDNISQSAFALSNFTLTINETFIFIPPIPPVIGIDLISPLNDSVNRNGSVFFSFTTNVSGTASLLIDNIFQQNLSAALGSNTFLEISFTVNETILWNVTLINGATLGSSETFILLLNLTQLPEIEIFEDFFQLRVCPLQNLQSTILFIFFIILAFVIMIMGNNMRIGIVGFLGAFMILALSAFLYICLAVIGFLLTAVGLMMMSFFIFKGTRNFE